MTQALRPLWLARAHVGLAHAFLHERESGKVSCCGLEREEGLPWEPAGMDRRKCHSCGARLRQLQRAADAKAAKERAS